MDRLRNFTEQLKKLEQQVQELRYQPLQNVRVGARQDVDALEVHNQFGRGGECIYQYQLGLIVPGTRQLLALSYIKAQPMGDLENAQWTGLKNTLVLN